jgi:hypothetical protein
MVWRPQNYKYVHIENAVPRKFWVGKLNFLLHKKRGRATLDTSSPFLKF